jgi:hypothetical protein
MSASRRTYTLGRVPSSMNLALATLDVLALRGAGGDPTFTLHSRHPEEEYLAG